MLGLWKMKSGKGYISHAKGLTKEQAEQFHLLKEGDKLVVFINEVREGEMRPHLSLQRSTVVDNK